MRIEQFNCSGALIAQFIMENYISIFVLATSYKKLGSMHTEMLRSLGGISLKCRRDICRVTMFFRILHNEISIPSHHLPIPITSCTRGHSQRFRQFPVHLSVYLNSFFQPLLEYGMTFQYLQLRQEI